MMPEYAIMTTGGTTVAMYLTKPLSRDWTNVVQEIQLLKLFPKAPDDIMEIYNGNATSS